MASSLASSLTLLLAAASALTQAEAAGPGTFHPRGASYGAVDLETRDDALSSPSNALINRGTDQAPDGYVPASVSCPSDRPTIRNGTTLSPQEREWLPKRRNETIAPIRELLARIGIPDFDSDAYLRNVENDARALPNIGLAVSGGGYRAMLNGAGALAAWDSRTDGSTQPGNLGGLLQSATYLSGLSGGGWLVGSLMMNNFTSVQKSVNYGGIWQMENSIFEGPDQYSIKAYYTRIFEAVSDKKDAGYERSLTDYWGRMLSYQLINATDGGPGFTWSSLADDPDFSEGKTPLPILIADGRAPDEKIIALNATVFEFSPWELGSFDPTLHGFVPLKYVGSKFDNGEIPDNETCIRGFDNAGFVMGTSSSLFNQIVMYLNDPNSGYVSDKVPKIAIEAISALLEGIGDDNDDIADWTPNPFKGWNEAENLSVDSERLTLVDGGEDLQNVPYYPHIRLDRKVDVVFSVDSSADTESGWPDGASAIATYERSLEDIANGSAFPVVPGKATFRNLGFNTKPTFFGCNATNTSDPAPLIVYIPNYPYVYASNISTFQMTVNTSELTAIIENGYAVATQLNATRDADWPYCVGCAMLSRSFDRTNASVPAKCRECFTNYCWNGTLDESEPAPYWPEFISTPLSVQGFGTRVVSSSFGLVVAIVVGVFIAF